MLKKRVQRRLTKIWSRRESLSSPEWKISCPEFLSSQDRVARDIQRIQALSIAEDGPEQRQGKSKSFLKQANLIMCLRLLLQTTLLIQLKNIQIIRNSTKINKKLVSMSKKQWSQKNSIPENNSQRLQVLTLCRK